MAVWQRYLILFLANWLVTSEFWSLYGAMADEGMCVVGAQRLLQGEWPYRDFETDISPGIYVVGAAWFALAGISTLSIRCLFGLLSATTSVLIQGCSDRVLVGRWRALPWLLWTTGGVMEFPILNHHWLGACCTMFTWNCALGWCCHKTPRYQVATGVGLALSLWALQSEGLAVLLTLIFLGLRLRPPGLGRVILTSIVASLLLWAPFLPYTEQILRQNVIGITHHVAYNRFPYSARALQDFVGHYTGLSPSQGWFFFTAALSHIAINALRYLSLPVLVVVLWVGSERRRNAAEQMLAYAWMASLMAASGRMTLLYVSFQNAQWCLVVTVVLSWLPRGGWLAGALALTELVGWAARGWVRKQIYVYPISTRIGVYYSMDPGEAAAANQVGQWIQHEIPPATLVLAFPYAAHFYSSYSLRCPVRQALMPPGGVAARVFREAQEALQARQVEWLLYVHVNPLEVSGNFAVDPAQLEQEWVAVRQQLTQGYQLVRGTQRLGLYRKLPAR